MTLEEILQALIKRWKLIVFGTMFTGVVALAFSFAQSPSYETVADLTMAKSTVSVAFEQKLRTLSEGELVQGVQNVEGRRKALLGLVKNGTIASKVFVQLKNELPEGIEAPNQLMGMVEGESDGDLIRIKVSAKEPALAAKIANTWAQQYEQHINTIYGTTSGVETIQVVQAQMKQANQQYQSTQKSLEEFLANNQVNEITRQIEEKKSIIDSLQQGKKKAVETVVETDLEARSKIISAYLNAHADNLLKAFQEEQEAKRKLLSEYFNIELQNRLLALQKDHDLRKKMFNKVIEAAIENKVLAIDTGRELRKKMFTAFANAEIESKTTAFNQQVEDRLKQLTNSYAQRRTLNQLLADAEAMQKQIKEGTTQATSTSSSLSLLFLKAKAFNSAGEIPGNLEFSFDSIKNLETNPNDLVKDLNSLINILKERISDLGHFIQEQTSQLLKDEGYDFLDISLDEETPLTKEISQRYKELFQFGQLYDISLDEETPLTKEISQRYKELFQFGQLEQLGQKDYSNTPLVEAVKSKYPELFNVGDIAKLSESVSRDNPLAKEAMETSKRLLQLQGLEEIPTYTTMAEPMTKAIEKMENQVDALEAKLEEEKARKKEIMRARDLAWEKYDTLATKVSEVDIASAIRGTEVRLASEALPPTSPVSPKKKRNTLLGGFAGLILTLGVVLLIEHPAIKGLIEGEEEEDTEDSTESSASTDPGS